MSPMKLLAVAVACAVCCTPVLADDSPQPDGQKPNAEKVKAAVIWLSPAFDADESVTLLRKLMPAETGIPVVKVPLFHAIVVIGTAEEVAAMWKMLMPL